MSEEEQTWELAMLELLLTGSLTRRKQQHRVAEWLLGLGWVRRTTRAHELELCEEHKQRLQRSLEHRWPEWRDVARELQARDLPPTPAGWRALHDHRRAERVPTLPHDLNHRTAAALTAPHAKARLTPRRVKALVDVKIHQDGLVRVRAPEEMLVRRGAHEISVRKLVALFGEVALPQRARDEGLVLVGECEGIVLIENLGAWQDMDRPKGWIFAHAPGWNTSGALSLTSMFPRAPLVLFGDLDPNGVRIMERLRESQPALHWLVPPFWSELVEIHAREVEWPLDLEARSHNYPALVRALIESGRWLEQEPLVVDARLSKFISAEFSSQVGE